MRNLELEAEIQWRRDRIEELESKLEYLKEEDEEHDDIGIIELEIEELENEIEIIEANMRDYPFNDPFEGSLRNVGMSFKDFI